jgi:WD40 repeat protein/serine/threonine protein kinase
LSGGFDGTLRLWDVATGQCLRVFEVNQRRVNSIFMSSDGRLALSGGEDNSVLVWEVETGRCRQRLEGATYRILSVHLTGDGSSVLAVEGNGQIHIWDVATGQCRKFGGISSGYARLAFFSSDGRFALRETQDPLTHRDRAITLWEVASGRCLRTFRGQPYESSSLSLNPDGRFVLSSSVDGLRLWEVSTGRCLRTFENVRQINCLSLNADGGTALLGGYNSLSLWDTAGIVGPGSSIQKAPPVLCRVINSKQAVGIQGEFREFLRKARSAKDGSRYGASLDSLRRARSLSGCGRNPEALDLWGELGLFCRRIGLKGAWLSRTFEGHKDEVSAVCFSSDGRLAMSGGKDKTLRLWEVATGKCLRLFEGQRDWVWSLCLSPDGRLALSGGGSLTGSGGENALRLWDINTGECRRVFQGHGDRITSVCLSKDGRLALSAGGHHLRKDDQSIRLWEVNSGRCLRVLDGHEGGISSLSLSSDDRLVLSGGADKTMRLWEVETGKCLRIFEGHRMPVTGVALSSDGRTALSGSQDTSLRLWDLAGGKCLRTFSEPRAGGLTSIALNKDGCFALAAGADALRRDNSVRLWDVTKGQCLGALEGHTKAAWSVCFSPDGRWVLSGGEDHTVRLWELDWELEAHEPADWDERARPHLEAFLRLHTPFSGKPAENEMAPPVLARPQWEEKELESLFHSLGCAGLGWLRPEGVRRELEGMALQWPPAQRLPVEAPEPGKQPAQPPVVPLKTRNEDEKKSPPAMGQATVPSSQGIPPAKGPSLQPVHVNRVPGGPAATGPTLKEKASEGGMPKGTIFVPSMPAGQKTPAPTVSGAHPPASAVLPQAESGPAEWAPGEVILGLYEVKEVLGEGGMGKVYKVRHRGWNLDLAVKCPKPEILSRTGGAENFEREAETWVNLGLHPNIVSCYYVRRLGGIPRVFAEYVKGGSLADWIRERKLYEGSPEQSLERMLDISIQFAWGLHYAHEQGLIHQDVKPANVMMTPEGAAKVTDFGLARARAMAPSTEGAKGTVIVQRVGMTPEYASPEQSAGQPLTRRADLWSWAVSVLEMFTGEVTWPSGSAAGGALEGYQAMSPEDGSIPRMPEDLAALLRRCFQEEPEMRPHDLGEIAGELGAIYQKNIGGGYPRQAPRPLEGLADTLNNRAVSSLDLGLEAEAEKCWQQALLSNSHHLAGTFNYHYHLWRKGRLTSDDLVKKFLEAEGSQGREADYWRCLAWLHFERGDTEALEPIHRKWKNLGEGFEAALRAPDRPVGRCRQTLSYPGKGHAQTVGLSPDGRLAATGGSDNAVRLWDLSSGRELRVCEGHTGGVTSVAFTADGRHVFSGSFDKSVRLWETATGRQVALWTHGQPVMAVSCFPRSPLALSGCQDGVVRLWNLERREMKGEMRVISTVNALAVSPDEKKVLIGSGWPEKYFPLALAASMGGQGRTAGVLCLWDWERGQTRLLGRPNVIVGSVCFSPDGRRALSQEGKVLHLWDLAGAREVRPLAGHTNIITSAAFAPQGHLAISAGGYEPMLRVWELETGQELRALAGHGPSGQITSVSFSPDGRTAVSASGDRTLRVWEIHYPLSSWGTAHPYPLLSRTRDVADLSRDQKEAQEQLEEAGRLIGQGQFRQAYFVLRQRQATPGYEKDREGQNLLAQCTAGAERAGFRMAWANHRLQGHTETITTMAISPDGRIGLSGSQDRTLRFWDLESGNERQKIEAGQRAGGAAFSPDGKMVLAVSPGMARLWDWGGGKELQKLEGEERLNRNPWAATFSPSGRYAAAACWNAVSLWDQSMGWKLRVFAAPSPRDIMNYCFSPDERLLLAATGRQTTAVWDTASGEMVAELKGHTGEVSAVSFSPDGRLVLSGSHDNTLRLWNLAGGRMLRQLQGHTAGITFVRFLPDGHHALSGSFDKTMRLWDLRTGQAVHVLKGHTAWVADGCVSPDGRYALTGSLISAFLDRDFFQRLWDLKTGRELAQMEMGHERPSRVCVSPDWRFALGGDENFGLRLWELDWDWQWPASPRPPAEARKVAPPSRPNPKADAQGPANTKPHSPGANAAPQHPPAAPLQGTVPEAKPFAGEKVLPNGTPKSPSPPVAALGPRPPAARPPEPAGVQPQPAPIPAGRNEAPAQAAVPPAPASPQLRIVSAKLGERNLTLSPQAVNRLTSSGKGIHLNRRDIPPVPFGDILLAAAFQAKESGKSSPKVLFFLRRQSRPFIAEGTQIQFQDFSSVKAANLISSLRNFLLFLHRENPGMILERGTWEFMGNPLVVLPLRDTVALATALAGELTSGKTGTGSLPK